MAIPKEEFTILLLGSTGAGKSTFINSFANLFKFNNFEDALKGKTEIFIPGEIEAYDDNFQKIWIKFEATKEPEHKGRVIDEDCDQIMTQYPQSYLIETPTFSVRLIDTPGFVTESGVEIDEKNQRAVMDYVSSFKQINAIAIVNDNNLSRLTPAFQYNTNGLLMNLHKSAIDNIIFIFTHTDGRRTPGDTLTILNHQLHTINKQQNASFKTTGNNVFCFENRWIREIIKFAKMNDFNNPQKDLEHCFDLGKHEVNRMRNMSTHDISESVCLSRVRTFLSILCQHVDDVNSAQDEENYILEETMAELAAFLQSNSIIVDNDAFVEHVDFLIEEEKKYCSNSNAFEKFEKTKKDHVKKVEAIQRLISSNKRKAKSVIDMNKLMDDLCKLEKKDNDLQENLDSFSDDIVINLIRSVISIFKKFI